MARKKGEHDYASQQVTPTVFLVARKVCIVFDTPGVG